MQLRPLRSRRIRRSREASRPWTSSCRGFSASTTSSAAPWFAAALSKSRESPPGPAEGVRRLRALPWSQQCGLSTVEADARVGTRHREGPRWRQTASTRALIETVQAAQAPVPLRSVPFPRRSAGVLLARRCNTAQAGCGIGGVPPSTADVSRSPTCPETSAPGGRSPDPPAGCKAVVPASLSELRPC